MISQKAWPNPEEFFWINKVSLENSILKENKELIFFTWAFLLLSKLIYKKCSIKK